MEAFNLAQLSKEMVVSQLKNLADPTYIAAQVVKGTLIARLKNHKLSHYEVREAIQEVCRGAIAGMILMDCSLPRGAVAILVASRQAGQLAEQEIDLIDIAAIKGISDAKRFVSEEVLKEMGRDLNTVRLGARELFEHFCGHPQSYQSHPAYIPPQY